MSVDDDLDERWSDAYGGRVGAGLVSTAPTRPTPVRPEAADGGGALDPLAGEDEPWADEDLLWTPDGEEFVRFFRSLWLAILVCLLFWVALAVGGIALFRVTIP